MPNISEIVFAHSRGKITSQQVSQAIAQLPCYTDYALRPGAYNGRYYYFEGDPCLNARKSRGLEEITGDYSPIPNMDRTLPEICLRCPVFAPALVHLAALLPKS